MTDASEVVTRFYQAFAQRDAEAMARCYDDTVHFSDPAFPSLKGEEARDMWRMLVSRGKDLRVEFRDVKAEPGGGDGSAVVTAYWEATYTFQATGKHVVNKIHARMTVRDGKIVRHEDSFDFYAWAKQALGLPGLLLGWAGFFQRKVQQGAGEQLAKFRAKKAQG